MLRLIDGYYSSQSSSSNLQFYSSTIGGVGGGPSAQFSSSTIGSSGSGGATGRHGWIQSTGVGGGPVRRASSYPEEATLLVRPQVIVAEEEKLFVEEMEGTVMVVKER